MHNYFSPPPDGGMSKKINVFKTVFKHVDNNKSGRNYFLDEIKK
jgi:hypothetical protein